MFVKHFDTIAYLKDGTLRQKQAYSVLLQYQILESLAEYTPILAGTIPLNIDIESSDLDIICCYTHKNSFIESLLQLFNGFSNFNFKETSINSTETVIVNLTADNFELEIFGQNVPVKEQLAYRHMITEYSLLQHYGEELRQEIVTLKKQGYKTEPAFAKALGLSGDPYQALLEYKID